MLSPMGFSRSDWRLMIATVVATVAAGVTHFGKIGGTVVPFVVAALALALLASLVGRSVEALGDRLGAGATGVVQSALGNLPELFVVLFALQKKLYDVATATIVGSILANVAARTLSMLLTLSVAALLVPSLTAALGSHATKAALHERNLSVVVSILLLSLFVASLPSAIKRQKAGEAHAGGGEKATVTGGTGEAAPADGGTGERTAEKADAAVTASVADKAGDAAGSSHGPSWPLAVALTMLAVTGVGAAFVSDWFVAALEPAMDSLGISQAFAGLVIVAIAGNAVENVVGIQLALKNQADYALSVILQSPLQIALVVAPALVLLSPLVGASFTLVLSPLLIAVLIMAVVITVLVVLDGESNWLEGATLMVLYGIIATAFWWG
jgi:Ca2+:H+ antiporter